MSYQEFSLDALVLCWYAVLYENNFQYPVGCHQAMFLLLVRVSFDTHFGVAKLTPRIHFETTLVSRYKR